jgi:hypothetical protein
MCMTEVPLLEVVGLCVHLALYASLGSWCNLGQTHERWHVDGKGSWARLCIYLKGLPGGSQLTAFLVANWAEPNGGSRWMAKTAVLGVLVGSTGAVVRWKAPLVAVEYEARS